MSVGTSFVFCVCRAMRRGMAVKVSSSRDGRRTTKSILVSSDVFSTTTSRILWPPLGRTSIGIPLVSGVLFDMSDWWMPSSFVDCFTTCVSVRIITMIPWSSASPVLIKSNLAIC